MNYDFKEGCYIDIPRHNLVDEAYINDVIEHTKKELEFRAFSKVAEYAFGENGVNVKFVWCRWTHEGFGGPTERIGIVSYLSFPKEHIMKVEPFDWKHTKQQDYHCVWCGAKNPVDDKYHSGTCENCGGPKL